MADGAGARGLKLLITDEEDLKVASCCLQDALVPVLDMCFQRGEQRFVMVVNRFRWETELAADDEAAPAADEAGHRIFSRTNCGVVFEGVRAVKSKGVDPMERGRILELLAVERVPGGILLHFAGGGCLRLETETVAARLEDLGAGWPTLNRPRHDAVLADEKT